MDVLKPTPNQEVISTLKELLNEAESGEIQTIAVAGVMHGAKTFNCFSGDAYIMALLGEVVVLERDIMDCCIDLRRKPLPEYCE